MAGRKLPQYLFDSPANAISFLLSRSGYDQRDLKPETALSIDVADTFRRHIRTGAFKGVFTKIPNEGVRTAFLGGLLKAMGMITGAGDFIFTWEKGSCWIELKQPGKKLEQEQRLFKIWCEDSNVPYVTCSSAQEVENAIKALGGMK